MLNKLPDDIIYNILAQESDQIIFEKFLCINKRLRNLCYNQHFYRLFLPKTVVYKKCISVPNKCYNLAEYGNEKKAFLCRLHKKVDMKKFKPEKKFNAKKFLKILSCEGFSQSIKLLTSVSSKKLKITEDCLYQAYMNGNTKLVRMFRNMNISSLNLGFWMIESVLSNNFKAFKSFYETGIIIDIESIKKYAKRYKKDKFRKFLETRYLANTLQDFTFDFLLYAGKRHIADWLIDFTQNSKNDNFPSIEALHMAIASDDIKNVDYIIQDVSVSNPNNTVLIAIGLGCNRQILQRLLQFFLNDDMMLINSFDYAIIKDQPHFFSIFSHYFNIYSDASLARAIQNESWNCVYYFTKHNITCESFKYTGDWKKQHCYNILHLVKSKVKFPESDILDLFNYAVKPENSFIFVELLKNSAYYEEFFKYCISTTENALLLRNITYRRLT